MIDSTQTNQTKPQDPPALSAGLAGPEPQPVDRVLAVLIDDNYDRIDERRGRKIDSEKEPVQLPAGWSRMGDEEMRAAGIDPMLQSHVKSGFDASFYKDTAGTVALVYAGTDEFKDWYHNFGQGLGFKDVQYDMAVELAAQGKAAFGDKLILTGQSLGGGLAAAASMVQAIPAVTFNAAGVHDKTLERYGFDATELKREADEGLVRHYVVKNDILTYLQEKSLLDGAAPDAPGKKIMLPDPDPLKGIDRVLPWKIVKHGIDVHFIESVQTAMDLAGYTLAGEQPKQHAPRGETGARLLRQTLGNFTESPELGIPPENLLPTALCASAECLKGGLENVHNVVKRNGGDELIMVEGKLSDVTHKLVKFDPASVDQRETERSLDELLAAVMRKELPVPGEPQLNRTI